MARDSDALSAFGAALHGGWTGAQSMAAQLSSELPCRREAGALPSAKNTGSTHAAAQSAESFLDKFLDAISRASPKNRAHAAGPDLGGGDSGTVGSACCGGSKCPLHTFCGSGRASTVEVAASLLGTASAEMEGKIDLSPLTASLAAADCAPMKQPSSSTLDALQTSSSTRLQEASECAVTTTRVLTAVAAPAVAPLPADSGSNVSSSSGASCGLGATFAEGTNCQQGVPQCWVGPLVTSMQASTAWA